MLSRALSLATVMLLIGAFGAAPAWAQATNLEAGKSPSQIFAGTCTACHKGPRGLLKTVAPGSLGGFLRQHYTTSPEMASLLAGYLVSNGASDRSGAGKQGRDGKQEANSPGTPPEQLDRFGRRMRPAASSQEAAKPDTTKPDADGRSPQAEPGRAAKRLGRPGEPSEAAKPAAEGQVPAQAAIERGPDGRKLTAKQRLGRHAKPSAEEPPKADAVREEPAKGEPEKDDKPKNELPKNEPKNDPKSESAKIETGKPEPTKPENTSPADNSPAGQGKSETKIEAPKDTGAAEKPALRADPVPPVTPAPPAAPAPSTAASSALSEPAPAARPSAPAAEPAPPAVTASAPPPAPPAAGPPAPPISQ